MIPPFTTVVAVDRAHADELEIVWPTWVRFRPEILRRPMILIVDIEPETGLADDEWNDRLAFIRPHFNGLHQESLTISPWGWRHEAEVSQRERMLTSLVWYAPHLVKTDYWLKLDTDLVALRASRWIEADWFAPQKSRFEGHTARPAIVAPPWSYTKPAGTLATLDAWAASREWYCPPLAPQQAPGDCADYLPRIISWCCWIHTGFSQFVAKIVGNRLPVPSQDTLHWYVAMRDGQPIVRPQMKRLGWAHCGRLSRLKQLAAEALEGVHA